MNNRLIGTVLAACVALVVAGCSNAKQKVESSANLKELSRAVIKFQNDNGAWPEALADLKPVIGTNDDLGVIGGGKDYAKLVRNPLTGDDPGYEYVKPPADLESRSGTIVLYQLQDGKRDSTLPVAYLDGSVRPAGGG